MREGRFPTEDQSFSMDESALVELLTTDDDDDDSAANGSRRVPVHLSIPALPPR